MLDGNEVGRTISATALIFENHTHTHAHTHWVLKKKAHILPIEFCEFADFIRVHIKNEK